jgi:aminoglycoside phosphotransferase (APT) family kinase protein
VTVALDSGSVRQHLLARGLLADAAAVSVDPLAGGVSSDIVAVSGPGVELVVKRALPRLRVAQEWLADDGRIVREARALELAAQLVPGAVPAVIDLDEETRTLVIERAPAGWRNWRDELLEGHIDESVAEALGSALARWHGGTAASPPAELADARVFVQLRLDPFYRAVADRHPRLAERIGAVADALLETHTCLVHGDFSPKNVLHGDERLWVLDWEVAHVGDPCFDLAHLLAHLVLKAVHRPADARRYRSAAESFLRAYGRSPDDGHGLIENLGCLLLARVDGKSPAPYLTEPERARVRALAVLLLSEPPAGALDVWEEL